VPDGAGTDNLQPLGLAGAAAHLGLLQRTKKDAGRQPPSRSSTKACRKYCRRRLTGLEPKQPYVLALATQANGHGRLEPLAAFMTNPAGSAIVNAVGPIRQIVQSQVKPERRYLVIVPNAGGKLGQPVQVQVD